MGANAASAMTKAVRIQAPVASDRSNSSRIVGMTTADDAEANATIAYEMPSVFPTRLGDGAFVVESELIFDDVTGIETP